MRRHDIELKFVIEGATAEEIARGEAAAWAVFETAGVSPWVAARAVFKQEGEMGGMLPGEGELAELWREAEYEAV